MKGRSFEKRLSRRCKYAREEEFISVFHRERAGLQRLALLLTASSEATEQCLISAFRDCVESRSVVKEWVLSWARRIVIRNAISLVMGAGQSFVNASNAADSGLIASRKDRPSGAIAEPGEILDLPMFERFVFVICVLERYTIHDCALLLGKSPRDINEARRWACNQVGRMDEPVNNSQRLAMP